MLLRLTRRIHMPTSTPFPLASLLPKSETHADKFLEKYPDYDGRGVKVAIFDTGVDPGAIGLQKTTTGAPKILDLIDATGSGDVKLTTVPAEKVLLDANNSIYEIEGLSGRSLKIPTTWVKGEGIWQIGLKRVYELWPSDLVKRISKERKDVFLQQHHDYSAETQFEYSKLEILQEPDDAQKESKRDLESQLQALKTLEEEYKDDGPVYDCVVFKPKVETALEATSPFNLPWAVVDTTETGELSSLKPMNAYRHSQQFGVFSEASLMSYSYNFYDHDILSINVVSGTHGTHVAGIVAAHYSDNTVLDGIAPGAQIISIKIGDSRMGSIETSQSFMRAMTEAIKLGVDIINISYGEDSHLANAGPIMDYMRDKVIRKHKITVVSSAGNNGPGYSTIGAPGGMTSSIISVGAYVSREMAEAQYALRDQAGNSAYTWSSRGPSIDGDKGVTIFAPGAAITCVPPYALNHSQLMNGTSMSSPNAAGGVALLISAAKSEAVAFSPGSLKRSLERTARDVADEFHVGMLDIPSAFQDMKEGDGLDSQLYFDIKVDGSQRGILIRSPEDLAGPKVFNVEIKPFLDESATKKKFELEIFTKLECDDSFVEFAEFVHLNYSGRVIQIKVDSGRVNPGLHVSNISGKCSTTGKTLFDIPVTIVKPIAPVEQRHVTFDLRFTPGKIERRYLQVPTGIEGCSLQMITSDVTTPIQLWTAVTQFQPDTRRTWTSAPFVQNLGSSDTADRPVKTIKLVEGAAEFCFAQFWSSVSDQPTNITVKVEFHGLHGDYGKELSIIGGSGYKQIQVKSAIGTEQLKPNIRLDMLRKHLRPSKSTVTALGSRDILEDTTRLYSMILQYSITFARAGESQVILPMSGTLYENPWYSAFFSVFDEDKNLVFFSSTYPAKHKFEKKTYTVLVELVHKSRSVLEKMKDQLISIESGIEKEITVDAYDNFLKVWTGPKAEFKDVKLNKGVSRSIAISNTIDLPKEASYGDLLIGSIVLGTHKDLKRPVKFAIPPSPSAKPEEEKPKSILDLQIEMCFKIADKDEKTKYLEELSKAHPQDLKLLEARLDNAKDDEKEYIANSIIDLIDTSELARYYGVSHPSANDQTESQKEESKIMTRSKALLAKALAVKMQHSKSDLTPVFEEFMKWTDPTSAASLLTQAKAYLGKKQYGRATVKLQEARKTGDLKKEQEKDAVKILRECCDALHWSAWVHKLDDDQRGRNPKDFRGF